MLLFCSNYLVVEFCHDLRFSDALVNIRPSGWELGGTGNEPAQATSSQSVQLTCDALDRSATLAGILLILTTIPSDKIFKYSLVNLHFFYSSTLSILWSFLFLILLVIIDRIWVNEWKLILNITTGIYVVCVHINWKSSL